MKLFAPEIVPAHLPEITSALAAAGFVAVGGTAVGKATGGCVAVGVEGTVALGADAVRVSFTACSTAAVAASRAAIVAAT